MTYATKEERVERCIKRHPDWTAPRIANSIGCSILLVRARMIGEALPKGTEKKTGLISLTKVMERYDIKAAILKALATIPREQLVVEADLCQRAAGTDRNRFRRTVENNNEVFKVLRIKLKLENGGEGKWYWGHPDDIAEAHRIREI